MTEHEKLREKLQQEVASFISNGGKITKLDQSPYKFYGYEYNVLLRKWYESTDIDLVKELKISKVELKSYVKGLKKLNKKRIIDRLIS